MLQRIQTVYLLLSIIFLAVFIFLPTGTSDEGNFIPKNDMLTMILIGFAALLALTSIFMYKNRRVQIRFCGRAIASTIVLAIMTIYALNKENYTIGYGIALLPLVLMCVWLAIVAIKKDEKLVRDMDRLR